VLRFPNASTSGPIVCNRSGFCFGFEFYAVRTEPEIGLAFVDGNGESTVLQDLWPYHFAAYEEVRFHFEVSVRFRPGDDGLCFPARGSGTMNTGVTPAFSQGTASKRSVPRYELTVPLALTVLRSGIPNNIPGRTLEISEGGMGVVPASQLIVGESVRVEFLVPHTGALVRATAVVRYQHERCFGLQFLRLPVEQQSIVRYWTRREGELLLAAQADDTLGEAVAKPKLPADFENSENSTRKFGIRRIVAFAGSMTVIAAVLGWWQWQQGWAELEAQLPAKETVVVQPQLKVPADAMGRRIIHQVMPEYPELARQAGVQGTVVLDTVVSVEGAVTQVKFVSGPEALSQAAKDAVRWWRYEPYFVNGQPATVETTVAVDFRLAN
jgi:TonB family protein